MPDKGRRKGFLLVWMMLMMFLFPALTASAAEETAPAEELSHHTLVTEYSGFHYYKGLFDKESAYGVPLADGAHFTLTSDRGMGSVYMILGEEYGDCTVTDPDTGREYVWNGNGMLHRFLDLEEVFGTAPDAVMFSFEQGEARVAELRVFASGQVPDSVQRWEPPVEGETDLILFSAHGDDEQLFFAGLLPYYAGELDCQVQVVYLTDHSNNSRRRVHEMLDGLWAVGVRTYPVFGTYDDIYTDSLELAYQKYGYQKITEEELLKFVLEQLRRFRPKVVVGHDLAGEYGHGMHMLYADLLCKAVEISGDPEEYPELAEKYGVWDVPKTYLHLYEENPVLMDWDQPLESFDGKTAYEVTRDLGFPCHKTQWKSYAWFFRGNRTAAQIRQFSPCQYGLFRSTVGEDVRKNDFFENLTTYARDRLDQEALIAAEEARRQAEAEEARRLEAEKTRIAEEARREQARREQELLQAEQERIAEEKAIAENNLRKNREKAGIAVVILGLGLLAGSALYAGGKRRAGVK